jgi:hypothetical protein
VEGTGIFSFNVNCSVVNCSGEALFLLAADRPRPGAHHRRRQDHGPVAERMTLGAVESITTRTRGRRAEW